MPEVPIRMKGQREEPSIDLGEPSQADWIRKYVTQLEEDEEHEQKAQQEQAEEVPSAIYFS